MRRERQHLLANEVLERRSGGRREHADVGDERSAVALGLGLGQQAEHDGAGALGLRQHLDLARAGERGGGGEPDHPQLLRDRLTRLTEDRREARLGDRRSEMPEVLRRVERRVKRTQIHYSPDEAGSNLEAAHPVATPCLSRTGGAGSCYARTR
jgi:hypothetical protein